MNKDELKGKIDNAKGRVKEAAGALTGDKQTQAEGMAERVKGAVQEKFGQVKGDVERAIDKHTTPAKKPPADEADDE